MKVWALVKDHQVQIYARLLLPVWLCDGMQKSELSAES